ncbi:hypothetical protein PybrP1_007078 [[Pythium] brassicae (nom. inval.)]|nr:hypothetical protein PybrP1_007078 [[Pythium] brassicae (nom. inval.)]
MRRRLLPTTIRSLWPSPHTHTHQCAEGYAAGARLLAVETRLPAARAAHRLGPVRGAPPRRARARAERQQHCPEELAHAPDRLLFSLHERHGGLRPLHQPGARGRRRDHHDRRAADERVHHRGRLGRARRRVGAQRQRAISGRRIHSAARAAKRAGNGCACHDQGSVPRRGARGGPHVRGAAHGDGAARAGGVSRRHDGVRARDAAAAQVREAASEAAGESARVGSRERHRCEPASRTAPAPVVAERRNRTGSR